MKEPTSIISHAKISQTTDNQRAYKRVRVNMMFSYRDNDYANRMGRVCNISKGGMFVETGHCPNVDGFVSASLNVEPFGKVIWVIGQVVRKTDSGMAIIFTRKDDKGLNNFMSYLCAPF
ncbi:MAG: PilZ domain-containing protein [Desulfomonilia bacterium]